MTEFAKLFTTPHGQLLITREGMSDEYDDQWVLIAQGEDYRGQLGIMAFTYESQEDMDQAFEGITLEHADNTAQQMQVILEMLFGKEEDA